MTAFGLKMHPAVWVAGVGVPYQVAYSLTAELPRWVPAALTGGQNDAGRRMRALRVGVVTRRIVTGNLANLPGSSKNSLDAYRRNVCKQLDQRPKC